MITCQPPDDDGLRHIRREARRAAVRIKASKMAWSAVIRRGLPTRLEELEKAQTEMTQNLKELGEAFDELAHRMNNLTANVEVIARTIMAVRGFEE